MPQPTPQQPGERPLQPWLHDLTLVLAAPTQAWSGLDGQVRDEGVQGMLHSSRRFVSELLVTVDGEEPVITAHHDAGGDAHVFVSVMRRLGGPGPDPTVRPVRRREAGPGWVREQLSLHSAAAGPVECTLRAVIGADLAPLDEIKAGARRAPALPERVTDSEVTWSAGGFQGRLQAVGATVAAEGHRVVLTWPVRLAPGAYVTL